VPYDAIAQVFPISPVATPFRGRTPSARSTPWSNEIAKIPTTVTAARVPPSSHARPRKARDADSSLVGPHRLASLGCLTVSPPGGPDPSAVKRGSSSPASLRSATSQPCGHFGSCTPCPCPRGFAAPSPAARGARWFQVSPAGTSGPAPQTPPPRLRRALATLRGRGDLAAARPRSGGRGTSRLVDSASRQPGCVDSPRCPEIWITPVNSRIE
jgi:hypothetical protein